MDTTRPRRVLAGTLALGLAAGSFVAGRLTHTDPAQASPTDPVPAAAPATRPPSFADIVAAAAPAVVHVRTVGIVDAAEGGPGAFGDDGPFGPQGPFGGFGRGFPMPRGGGAPARRATGSGFVVRGDGIILTNNHVVERAKEITVAMSDGKELPAKVLGRDPKTDLAVLKVESPTPLPIVPLGDSDRIAVGDWVVAIGNPFGLDNSVTAGIVSAKGRAIGQGPYDQFIQTDASINPGNSGGPLFDERGNVVGINTAIFSQSGGNIGIGFAIPVNVAKELVPQLEKDGHVTRGWLGVSIQKLTPELAESMGVGQKDGVLVGGITPDSPAAKAGLASGDVIQQWNGKAVDDPAALATAVAGTAVGKTVPVEVKRDGKTRTVQVTVDRMADDEQVAADASGAKRGRWGLAVRELSAEERREREMAGSEGVLVTGVAPDSPAAEAGIKEGDIVLQVNRAPVGSVAALRKAVEKTPSGKPLLLLVRTSEGGDRFAALAAR